MDPSAQLVERPAVCPQSLASGLALSCLLPMLRPALKPAGYGSSLLALGEETLRAGFMSSLWASQQIVTSLYVCLNEVRSGLASGERLLRKAEKSPQRCVCAPFPRLVFKGDAAVSVGEASQSFPGRLVL